MVSQPQTFEPAAAAFLLLRSGTCAIWRIVAEWNVAARYGSRVGRQAAVHHRLARLPARRRNSRAGELVGKGLFWAREVDFGSCAASDARAGSCTTNSF